MYLNFFYFGSKLVMSTFQAEPMGLKEETIIQNLIIGKYEGIKFPVKFEQTEGKKLADILDTGFAGLYLISDNLKKILEEENFTGWDVYPITVFDKKKNEVKNYYGFSVLGVCGPQSYKNSKIIEKRLVPNGPLCRFYKGVSLELDKWDGSDFFTAKGSVGTIIVKKVADILQNKKVTNMRLTNLTEIEMPEFFVNQYLNKKNN